MRTLTAAFGTFLFVACGSPLEPSVPPAPSAASAATGGRLTNLEASFAQPEAWMLQDESPMPLVYYAKENLRVSASCRAPDGMITCEAVRFMRQGSPVDIPRRALDGRTSAGIKICRKMNLPIVTAHNSVGAEDSLCKFPDGSYAAAGALETYALHVMD